MLPDDRKTPLQDRLVGRVEKLERRTITNTKNITNIHTGNETRITLYSFGKIIRFDPTYNTTEQYPKGVHDTITSTDFDNALSDATSGDIILIPAGTIGGNHAMIAGVKVVGRSRYATILSGQITGASGASIENLSIIRSANSADNLVGVDSPASGTFYINDCDIEITQAGSGDAYALLVDTGSTVIEAWDSYLFGSSGSGSGYAGYHSAGDCYIYGGRAYGTTNPFNV